jgi:diguanylate cyclase (GGDEF)-like protein
MEELSAGVRLRAPIETLTSTIWVYIFQDCRQDQRSRFNSCARRGFRAIATMSRATAVKSFLLLPTADEREAIAAAERIRRGVEAACFPNPASRVCRYITISIGLAVQASADETISPEQLLRRADTALYLAKKTGRNRVVLHKPDSSST